MNISAVIITKNEAHIIGKTLQAMQQLTNDIIIVDSGSTDDTVAICKKMNTVVIETSWDGYGANKNKGIAAAQNNWILNTDADEIPDEELIQSLLALQEENENTLFEIKFKNFFCGKQIRFGEWGFDKHIRLFSRNKVKWNNAAVHEELMIPDGAVTKTVAGSILHYTTNSMEEYQSKTIGYAKLNAQKYFALGKKASVVKQYLSPVFSFLQNYIFRFGFLDGKEGFTIAKTTARYTFLKYKYLIKLNKGNKLS